MSFLSSSVILRERAAVVPARSIGTEVDSGEGDGADAAEGMFEAVVGEDEEERKATEL